jgi:voltage-dependent calcium channel
MGIYYGIVLVTLWVNMTLALFNGGSISQLVGAFKCLRALRLLYVSDSARDTLHSVVIVGAWKVISASHQHSKVSHGRKQRLA